MSVCDDANELLNYAEGELVKIGQVYQQCLHAKHITGTLRIRIKNFVENLRSALDFAARGLFEKYGSTNNPKPKVYFPYATSSQDRTAFEKSGRIEACVPGITNARPDIVQILLEVQHFGSYGFTWLPDFMELTNENKHERLTPQIRRETKELYICDGHASMAVGEGATVSVGPGASISIGGAVIKGGQTFGVERALRVEGGTAEIITWVSFSFDSIGQPVLPFLQAALKGTRQIVTELVAK